MSISIIIANAWAAEYNHSTENQRNSVNINVVYSRGGIVNGGE